MMKITNFVIIENEGVVSWDFDGQSINKRFNGKTLALPLINSEGILVLFFYDGMGADNAIILNPDGTEKCQINNPCKDEGAICFEDAYYVGSELTLIVAFKTYQMACVIDHDGNLLMKYETR